MRTKTSHHQCKNVTIYMTPLQWKNTVEATHAGWRSFLRAEKKNGSGRRSQHRHVARFATKRGRAPLLPSIQYQWHYQRRRSRTLPLASALSHTEKSHLLPCLNFRTKTAGCQSLPQTGTASRLCAGRPPLKARRLSQQTRAGPSRTFLFSLSNSEIALWDGRKRRRRRRSRKKTEGKKKKKNPSHVVRKRVHVFGPVRMEHLLILGL